eukprot:TRINITY_DN19673_c0_g1_i6.p1 TRINITY_DN19673_c0_g1~~TRINITY_DN19673_c0_g1_i6.p1  ORF type:complete len:149 (-),score=35.28 TRINITY_DN19673_c0_g1_i6:26-472(-)
MSCVVCDCERVCFFFFQAEDGIRDAQESRGLGDVYKRQHLNDELMPPTFESIGPSNAMKRFLDRREKRMTKYVLAQEDLKATQAREGMLRSCLLYTSDAADEEDSVDLGGRRIIKKKKKRSSSNIRRNDLRLNKRTCRVIKTLRCIGQ